MSSMIAHHAHLRQQQQADSGRSDTSEVCPGGPPDTVVTAVITPRVKTYSEGLGFCKGSETDGEDSGQALDQEHGGSGG